MHDAGETVDYHHGRRVQPRDPSICRDHASRPAVKEHPTLSRNQHSCPVGAAQVDSPAGGSSVLPTSRETSERQRTWALAPTQSGSREGGHGGLARLISWSVGSPDPRVRSHRALEAAASKQLAGASQEALRLLANAAAGPQDVLDRARVKFLHGQIEVDRSHGAAALPLLLDAAKQLEPLDVSLSRDAYLAALRAASVAGRLGPGMIEVARAALQAPRVPDEARAVDQLVDGLAVRFTDGYAAGVPVLKRGLATLQKEGERKEVSVRWPWFARFVATWGASARVPLRPVGEQKEQWDRRFRVPPWVPRVRESRSAADFVWTSGSARALAR